MYNSLCLSETILSKYSCMHALQFYFHTTVSADLFFLPFSQKDFIGLSPPANHDFGFFCATRAPP